MAMNCQALATSSTQLSNYLIKLFAQLLFLSIAKMLG